MRREGRSDDGRGVIDALKKNINEKQDTEATKEAAELEQRKELVRKKRQEVEKKQEVERMKQARTKQEAGMGPDTRVWGEAGGGFFGWKHIRNWYNRHNRPRNGEGEK